MALNAVNSDPRWPEQVEPKFDLSIALALYTWQALTLAVQEQWGGPDSSEKRDWFAGAISDLFQASDDAMYEEYLEQFMLQIMTDEFDVNVEDGSGEPIARLIIRLRKECLQGQFSTVDDMLKEWEAKQRQGGKDKVKFAGAQDQDQDTDEDVDDSSEDEDGDVAPELTSAPLARPRHIPEVDEDGFTKVVGRRNR